MRLALATGSLLTATALLAAACGLKFDVSRIAGLNASFDLARDPEEAIIPECRLIVPPYEPDAEPETLPSTRTFLFRGVEQSISILLDMRLLEASRTIGTERCWMSEFDADDFYESVVFDPAEEPFFEALLAKLRRLRDGLELDGSGYAEILVAFVQSLDYEAGGNVPKHPIAAFADGVGDCDEKSALLAGLLAREGYDVCLFLFLEEEHMAVGLHADGIGYRGTGYAYVEATAASYVGRSPFGWNGPAPEVIEMGDGKLDYTPSREQIYLDLAAHRARERIDDAGDLAAGAPEDPVARRALRDQMQRFVNRAVAGGDPERLAAGLREFARRAPPGFADVLRDAVVYVLVARDADLAEAFAAVSATIAPAEDALLREVLEWPREGGIPSLGAP